VSARSNKNVADSVIFFSSSKAAGSYAFEQEEG